MNKKANVILHGEAMIFQSKLPSNAEQISASNLQYHIIADSETTGNHHVIDNTPGTTFYRAGDTVYMENTENTNVRCVLADRHDTIEIEPGTWEFGIQQEYCHLTQQLTNVRD
jgi:hypothetical protein